MSSSNSRAAKVSIAVVIGLIGLKVAAGAITGSLSILAQAIDSFLDLFAVVVTFLAIRIATRPADYEHPFGHGKAENIAAVVQAVLIILAGGSIIYSAVRRIESGATLELTEAGIGVMLVSIVVSVFLSRYLLRVSRHEDSLALEANAHNIAADVYSAAVVLVGLLVVRFTGLSVIDPVLAILVALFIFRIAYGMLKKSFGGIVDVKLPEDEENVIRSAIKEHFGEVVDFHRLRTRKAGRQRYIDLHLVMPRDISVEEAHRMCDHLEHDIHHRLPHADVTIHVEPCDENCQWCSFTCRSRKE